MEPATTPLSRREQYNVMLELEKLDPETKEGDLEDVTDLVFSAVGGLGEC